MAKKRSAGNFRGGYATVSIAVNRVFNLSLSTLFLVLSAPLFLLVATAIWLYDGRPIFYTGTRLGQSRRPYAMYKFRTLIPGADKIIGAEVLTIKHRVVTPIGHFLRNTRLDELPQLLNVFRGEMDIFGPRPQRPEIYESICKNIPGYDHRFVVKPGLIGYPQLFLPHNSPKRIQSIVDNKFLWRKQVISWEIFIVLYTIVAVARKVFQRAVRYLWIDLIKSRLLRQFRQKRELERLPTREGEVHIIAVRDGREERVGEAQLIDINEKAFLMHSDAVVESDDLFYDLVIRQKKTGERVKHKVARCRGKIYRRGTAAAGGHAYVIEYTPLSPFNYYIVYQYFLRGSLVD